MRTCYIVAYDIADPKRLQRVHRTMRGYGDPLQYRSFAASYRLLSGYY